MLELGKSQRGILTFDFTPMNLNFKSRALLSMSQVRQTQNASRGILSVLH